MIGDTATSTKNAHYYSWHVVVVIAFVHAIASLDRFLMGVVLIPLKEDLSLTDTQLGIVYGMGFALLYCMAGIPMGRIADRGNRRNLILIGCFVWTLATGYSAFAKSFSELFIARLGVGLGEAALVPASLSLIGAYVAREQLGLATGIFFTGATLGKALAFIGGGLLLALFVSWGGLHFAGHDFVPWQALLFSAMLPGFLAIALLVSVREPPRAAIKTKTNGQLNELWTHIKLHRWAYVLFGIAAVCATVCANILGAWMPSFLARRFNVSASYAAVAIGLVSVVAGPLGAVLGGLIGDKLNTRKVSGAPGLLVAFAMLLLIPATLFACVIADRIVLALAAYVIMHMMILVGGPQAYTGMQTLTPMRFRGLMLAIFGAVLTLVSLGAGPAIVGYLSDVNYQGQNNQLGKAVATAIILFSCTGIFAAFAVRRVFDRAVASASQLPIP